MAVLVPLSSLNMIFNQEPKAFRILSILHIEQADGPGRLTTKLSDILKHVMQ